jgi:spore germination cell wall hydrolase CwlJ-like protein
MKSPVRAQARALSGAVLVGAGLGLLLGGAYIAGGEARMAAAHDRAERLAPAAKAGFTEAALSAQAASMAPGALAVARRHDPLTSAGVPERDRQNAQIAANMVNVASTPQPSAAVRQPLVRASLSHPAAAAPHQAGALSNARALDCLSQAVYYEARGESAEGQEAVAQVVLNRTRHAGFPKTVCGVVYQGAQAQGCQFSFACDGSVRGPKEMTAWRRAQAIAARALGGFVMAEVGDATHFHVVGLPTAWGEGLVRVAQIGAHSFYRLTGRPDPSARATVYARASEVVADKPVFTEAKASLPPAPEGSSLMLAAAVAPAPGAAQKPSADAAPTPAAPIAKAASEAVATAKGAS